jgi:hypothetical protein
MKQHALRKMIVWSLLAVWLLAACQPASETPPAGPPEEEQPSDSPGYPAPELNEAAPAYPGAGAPEPIEASPAQGYPAPAVNEVPADILEKITADALNRAGLADAAVTVVRAEAVEWPDGSLGCPQPDMMYTQAIVPGYWVVLEVDGKPFDYRASQRGDFVLCENGAPPIFLPSS